MEGEREHIVTYVGKLGSGKHVVRHPDGRLEIQEDQTDWARVDALTEEQLERSIANDPDWAEFKDIDWAAVEVKPFVAKQAISIRLDPDVLEFFKKDGPGYQGRINAVLRHFMAEKKKAG
ncbi:MAG: BrnA antitoxin family protein [Methylobacterium sp.]|nr:BrnA antitoxin family protein [Methylobacterium sp.]